MNINECGETLIKRVLFGLNHVFGFNPIMVVGEFEPTNLFDLESPQTQNELMDLVLTICSLFNISNYANFKSKVRDFVNHSIALELLWQKPSRTQKDRLTFEKYRSKYNICLNYLHQCVRDDECDDRISFYRNNIKQMQLYSAPYMFKDFKQKFDDSESKEDFVESESRKYMRDRMNYDGTIVRSEQIPLCIPSAVDIKTREPKQGVKFAFDDVEEFYRLVEFAIREATPSDLKELSISDIRKMSGGYVFFQNNKINGNGVYFCITLNIRHTSVDGLIDTTDQSFAHHFLDKQMKKSDIAQCLSSVKNICLDFSKFQSLGLYRQFNAMVTKRIIQLLNSKSSADESFRYRICTCYRPQCQANNIYLKGSAAVKCISCNVAEFCLKCGSSSHIGDCDGTDEATEEFVRNSTKLCPNPRCRFISVRDGGCKHLKCTQCRTDWCWLCGDAYGNTPMNQHYDVPNNHEGVYGNECMGIVTRRIAAQANGEET